MRTGADAPRLPKAAAPSAQVGNVKSGKSCGLMTRRARQKFPGEPERGRCVGSEEETGESPMGVWRKILQAASHYDASACIYAGQTGAPIGFRGDEGPSQASLAEKPKSAQAASSETRAR